MEEKQDGWEQIGVIAQRMIMAWDAVEEADEARALVAYMTERQRNLVWKELWAQPSDKWRERAKAWLGSEGAALLVKHYANLGGGDANV